MNCFILLPHETVFIGEEVVFVLVIAKTHLLPSKGVKDLGKMRRVEGDYHKKFVWVRISLTTSCPVDSVSRTNLSCWEY